MKEAAGPIATRRPAPRPQIAAMMQSRIVERPASDPTTRNRHARRGEQHDDGAASVCSLERTESGGDRTDGEKYTRRRPVQEERAAEGDADAHRAPQRRARFETARFDVKRRAEGLAPDAVWGTVVTHRHVSYCRFFLKNCSTAGQDSCAAFRLAPPAPPCENMNP